jgi:hypothetical protein
MPDDPYLKIAADNPALLEALKRTLLKQFDLDNSKLREQINSNTVMLPDKIIGEKVRAQITAVAGIEEGFREILRHRTVAEVKRTPNGAR